MEEEITFIFKMDGDKWSCCIAGLDNLAEDVFGFGNTKKEALEEALEFLGPDLDQ